MKFWITLILFQLFCNNLAVIRAQWCVSFRSVLKTRLQWNNGQRMVSKRNFFGGIKYKYEPYVYSTVQNYYDYERVNVCCDGYNKVSDTKCEPICRPSCPNNSSCYQPNLCECNYGYRGYIASALTIQCEPVCSKTCPKNSRCTQPNKCSCNTGYTENGSGECQPVCKECPVNSICSGPELCSCKEGYADIGNGCQPVCSRKCPENSECTEPEKCSCKENYEMIGEHCFAVCHEQCPEIAECVRPDVCECKEGYEKYEETAASKFKCLPKCDETCPTHSECIGPNNCECLKGFRRSDNITCEPICENPCPAHGLCSKPNKCTCDKGYEMVSEQCQPVCEKPCPEFSICHQPNKCQCDAGYQLKLSSIYNLYCEPVCLQNCSSYAKCVAPNKCECLEGYEMDEMEVCRPVCKKGCKNGLCFQPEMCVCQPGYLMGPREECEPVCSEPCINGSCVEPEICQCYEGFELKNKSINICEPLCEPQCINGICVAPNVCICDEDYEPTTTENGLNHSNCRYATSTTTSKIEEFKETYETTEIVTRITSEDHILQETLKDHETSLHPDQLLQTTLPPSLVSVDVCTERCQCWQEFDEFGPLVTQKCARLCIDDHDKPCVDLNFCECDDRQNHLVCRTSYDSLEGSLEDPILYKCSLARFKVTTFKPLEVGQSSDMKSIQTTTEEANYTWLWAVMVGGLVALAVTGGFIYRRLGRVENPILEYEL